MVCLYSWMSAMARTQKFQPPLKYKVGRGDICEMGSEDELVHLGIPFWNPFVICGRPKP